MPDRRGSVRRRHAALLGGTVSYLEVGQSAPDQPSFVLLHGIPASAELWRGVLEVLGEAGRHAVAPDLPGYGGTRLPAGVDHGLVGMADVAEALVDHLELEQVELVGHDLGGGAAQIAAVRNPRRWATLTLSHAVSARLWPPPPMRLVFAAGARSAPLGGRVVRCTLLASRRALRASFGDGSVLTRAAWHRVFADGKVTDVGPSGEPGGRAAFDAHVQAVGRAGTSDVTADVTPRLADLDLPARLVWGTTDPAQPWKKVGRHLEGLLHGPAVTLLEGASHFAPLEQPDGFAAGLLAPAGSGSGA